MPRKTFVAGEVLAAADVNEFLADQVIMTFAGTAARGSAISVPVEGMVTYLEDDDQLEVYGGTAVGWSSASNFIFGTAVPTDGQVASYSTAVSGWVPADASSGKILQVVSTTKTDTFSASLTAGQETDITGMSVSITPSSTSNKILVIFTAHLSHSYAYGKGAVMLKRDSTKIAIGDASSSRNRGTSYGAATLNENNDMVVLSMNYLDSPSTTSAITYSLGTLNPNNGTNTVYLNRTANDFDGYQVSRTVSTITVMEIAG